MGAKLPLMKKFILIKKKLAKSMSKKGNNFTKSILSIGSTKKVNDYSKFIYLFI